MSCVIVPDTLLYKISVIDIFSIELFAHFIDSVCFENKFLSVWLYYYDSLHLFWHDPFEEGSHLYYYIYLCFMYLKNKNRVIYMLINKVL